MFLCLILLIGKSATGDSGTVDTVTSEIPTIIDFSATNGLESLLTLRQVIKPVISLAGYHDILSLTPFLLESRSLYAAIKSLAPLSFLINNHPLEDYFLQGCFTLTAVPFNFFEAVSYTKNIEGKSGAITFAPKVNRFEKPYSYLYFTMFGTNTIYNVDFARAFTDFSGIYLSGLYSHQYQNYDKTYLRTNGGYANLYFNRFIPLRLDFFLTANGGDTIAKAVLNDVALTLGSSSYKLQLFRNAFKLDNAVDENNFVTYAFNQKVLLSRKNFGHDLTMSMRTSQFQTLNCQPFKHEVVEFNHDAAFKIYHFVIGPRYGISYNARHIVFNAGFRLRYDFASWLGLMTQILYYPRPPDYVAHYGNARFILKPVKIIGNIRLRDERIFHKEFSLVSGSSRLTFFHTHTENPLIYQREGKDEYYVINGSGNNCAGIEGFFDVPLGRFFSLTTSYQYIFINDIPSGFPERVTKFALNWQKTSPRSVLKAFGRLSFVDKRYDLSGHSYQPFFTFSSGLALKFLTLHFGILFDNLLYTQPEDFSEIRRDIGLEIKWEFWD
ncbi:MAG: hypothetical protein ABIL39_10810 [candidate division WOR-3 bacterium]